MLDLNPQVKVDVTYPATPINSVELKGFTVC